MKPFNLKEYLANPSQKVVTRDGKASARIICTDAKSKYPVIALLSYSEDLEGCVAYTADGLYCIDAEDTSDLFFAPIKREGWVNIYIDVKGQPFTSIIYNTKEEALKKAGFGIITTTKITWEN